MAALSAPPCCRLANMSRLPQQNDLDPRPFPRSKTELPAEFDLPALRISLYNRPTLVFNTRPGEPDASAPALFNANGARIRQLAVAVRQSQRAVFCPTSTLR